MRKTRTLNLLITGFIAITLIFSASSCTPSSSGGAGSSTNASSAILYTFDETTGELEYNVVHSAPLSANVTVSGEINSLDSLKAALVVDTPSAVISTDISQRTIGKAVYADLSLNREGEIETITVTELRDRPVIGISWKRDNIGSDYLGFAEAYERNGAIAVFLPQVTSNLEARSVLGKIDGIFFTGGEDWNPSLYSEAQSPHGSSGWNDARDESDILLMQNAILYDIPLFAVCRGEQGFNVAMGGGLIQDIPYYLGEKVISGEISPTRVSGVLSGPSSEDLEKIAKANNIAVDALPEILRTAVEDTGYTAYDANGNRLGRTYDSQTQTYASYDTGCEEGHLRVQIDGLIHSGSPRYHEIKKGTDNEAFAISRDSKWLYDIVGEEEINLVATAHHQAVDPKNLAPGMTVVAASSDGIIEAIEYQAATYALAVQFHPERDALKEIGSVTAYEDTVNIDLCNAFLRSLVDHAHDAAYVAD